MRKTPLNKLSLLAAFLMFLLTTPLNSGITSHSNAHGFVYDEFKPDRSVFTDGLKGAWRKQDEGHTLNVTKGTGVEPGEDCNQGDDSNGFENGYNITAGSSYRTADDFFVSPGTDLHIRQIELNIFGDQPITSMNFHFYDTAPSGGPGDLLPAYTLSNIPTHPVYMGTAIGMNVYSVFAEADLTFPEGHYWIQPEANISEAYWETTTAGTLGDFIYMSAGGQAWEIDEDNAHGVFKLRCEPIEPPDPPECELDILVVEPITRVVMANVDNPSPADSSIPVEDFTDIEIKAEAGGSYPVAMEGNTMGNYTGYFTLFIDTTEAGGQAWSDYLTYEIGSVTNSTGTDGQQATNTVVLPEELADGSYSLRVIKNYNTSPTFPCGVYTWGQAEDYTLVVRERGYDCETDYPTTWANGLGNLQTQLIANDFEVPEDTEMTIEKLIIPIFADITDAAIEFYTDDEGRPGTSFAGPYTIIPDKELVGNVSGFNTYIMEFDLPEDVVAGTGVYWVSLGTTEGTEGNQNFWAQADVQTNSPAYASTDGGVTWNVNNNNQDGAFIVEGHCASMGIGDVLSFDFSYYPNPVRDVLYINSAKKVENVRLFNLTGQEIISDSKADSNGQIDVSALPTGVHVFRLILEGGQVETFKIIKK